jgi:hypothetical protein
VLSALIGIHSFLVWIVLLAGAVTLVCGIVLLVMRRGVADDETPPNPNAPMVKTLFQRLLIATAAIGALEALVGGLLFFSGARPGDQLHLVYGGIVLLIIPIAYVYSDQKRTRRDIIIMVVAAVLLIGAGVRALMTGAPM